MGGGEWSVNGELRDQAVAVLGHQFSDQTLLDLALSPPDRGFSRLEFLGDAILGLSLARAGVRNGATPGAVRRAESNDVLDSLLVHHGLDVGPRSGDVLEALVGAVHLDGGFEAAAIAAVRICGPELDGLGDQDAVVFEVWLSASDRVLSFVGGEVLSAAAADHVARSHPDGVAGLFSAEHHRLVARERLVSLVRSSPEQLPWTVPLDLGLGEASDVLEREVAGAFLEEGWDRTVPKVRRLLGCV